MSDESSSKLEETIGHFEWLLIHLWKKDNNTNQSCPNILIPDTILYHYEQPVYWFFCNKDSQILKKRKQNISPVNLHEAFSSHKTQSGIAAKVLKFDMDKNADKGRDSIEVEFLKLDDFKYWLDKKKKPFKGVLQKFVEPRGGRNHLIKVCWTPNFAMLERRTNNHTLDRRELEGRVSGIKEVNPELETQKRAVTQEGLEHFSVQESVLSVTQASDLHRACNSIAEHIRSVTNQCTKILKMNLYFKVDILERLYLVMATDLQIQIQNNQANDTKLVTIHPLSELKFSFTLPKYVLQGDFTSTSLDKEVDSDQEDTYKQDPLLINKSKEARENGFTNELAFYTPDFRKFLCLDVDSIHISEVVNSVQLRLDDKDKAPLEIDLTHRGSLQAFLNKGNVGEAEKEYQKMLDDHLVIEINPKYEFNYLNKARIRVECPVCMWQGYRDSLQDIELKFLLDSLKDKNFKIPQLSYGVPSINSDKVELQDRIEKTKGSPEKEKLRQNEDKAQDVPKPLQRIFNNLTKRKLDYLSQYSSCFMEYKFRCCMQCYLFLTQNQVYEKQNQLLIKQVMKKRSDIQSNSKRDNKTGRFDYTIHQQEDRNVSTLDASADLATSGMEEKPLDNSKISSNKGSTPGRASGGVRSTNAQVHRARKGNDDFLLSLNKETEEDIGKINNKNPYQQKHFMREGQVKKEKKRKNPQGTQSPDKSPKQKQISSQEFKQQLSEFNSKVLSQIDYDYMKKGQGEDKDDLLDSKILKEGTDNV